MKKHNKRHAAYVIDQRNQIGCCEIFIRSQNLRHDSDHDVQENNRQAPTYQRDIVRYHLRWKFGNESKHPPRVKQRQQDKKRADHDIKLNIGIKKLLRLLVAFPHPNFHSFRNKNSCRKIQKEIRQKQYDIIGEKKHIGIRMCSKIKAYQPLL